MFRIRVRRVQWVGHILRMHPTRLVHRALQHMHVTRLQSTPPAPQHAINTRHTNRMTQSSVGDLLMDIPSKYSWQELKALASNRDVWRMLVKAMKTTVKVNVEMNDAARAQTMRKDKSSSGQKNTGEK